VEASGLLTYVLQMVLDAGRLMEFDDPRELLKKDGLLKSLVDESADKDLLYAMAEGKNIGGR
jgi:hypothetical protein